MHSIRLLAGAVALALLTGCATEPEPYPASLATASPEAVARRYMQAMSEGGNRDALAVVWRPQRFDDPAALGDHLQGITDVVVSEATSASAEGRPSEYRTFVEMRESSVTYVTHATDSLGNPPGRYTLFVLMGRETADGPWYVVETGTGP